ncbi:MAG TPA: acyl-CoA dehydrogenase C-terminal domain-containing protein [Azospirillaceae bacterium]|nr:acyl-CoA dehydrogenase C-terminal domain-containing protein [Azospirillaceae bacterium]
MPTYKAPLEDIRFVLHELLGMERLTKLPGYGDASPELVDQILEEAARFMESELFPLNQSGDEEGCHYENGVVRTPKGFKEAYDKFREAGWTSLAAEPEYGGQGLPQTIHFALSELMSSANMAFGMYPGLSYGAYEALLLHGTEEQKQIYLPKLVDGTWTGTMCLTEAHCGTDLGMIRTKAVPVGDGSYKITGTKIFISAGEHDLADNIVHLVLAKLPDAPAGTRGISLFVVPKFLPKEQNGTWVAGVRNGVMCGSIEHKMGIKASSTAVLNFDEAVGWLVGKPHAGMKAMFTMMNAARLGVGFQGLGVAEVAYQNAVAYAKDRLQGRSLTGAKAPDKPADPIIVHPDVRKNLMWIKALNEGARALGLWVGTQIDTYLKHPDPAERQKAEDFVALMTPIVKAFFTDYGFEATVRAQQMYGGHGYIREWGMEQFVRDARIAQIYEGANAIQALDLVGRKLPAHMGRLLRTFFHPLGAELEEAMADPAMAAYAGQLAKAYGRLQQATAWIAQKGMANPEEAGAASTDYLKMFALVAFGWMWLRMAKVAAAKLPQADGRAGFYDAKLKTAEFFYARILPETSALFAGIMSGAKPMMQMAPEQF